MRVSARAVRRQRKNAAATAAAEQSESVASHGTKEASAEGDAYAWHTFGSDDEVGPAATTRTNRDEEHDDSDAQLSSSDSEAEGTLISGTNAVPGAGGLTGTAVTMQQVDEDEDDDEDDDRPLGAPVWLSTTKRASSGSNLTNAATAAAAANPPAAEVKKEDTTVQLLFQGLRSDDAHAESSAEQDGWSGIERGRRIAFQYVQMLRAEGII
ncbi:hypothetical protein EX895_004329 [Sporisorium graminicola]|uniref:Uncharacterized protein n=1 Tax=Sporisorium graminicola TaxID=280036 RepID=A0A4V6ETT5_9BASI|nr:hypothetical protein EX895_004329 [Sporisorium graminicola]TKY86689.1 hypothetical protein EX895_004329 [Sporisorium graminicola]